MFKTLRLTPVAVLAAILASTNVLPGAEMPVEEAWEALPKYEAGQDMAALLTIDREVIAAMKSPEARAKCAARLAALLTKEDTTTAAKQYICLQLRQVGTKAEVLTLLGLFFNAKTSDMARSALEAIPGPEAAGALRDGLINLEGAPLIGAINSVGARRDRQAVTTLHTICQHGKPEAVGAAIHALGCIADGPATAHLFELAKTADKAHVDVLQVALLRCAAAGQRAEEIYKILSHPDVAPAKRRAALEGLLDLQGDKNEATVIEWFCGKDADRRRIAAGHLQSLSDDQLDKLLGRLAELPDASKLAVIELAASRRGNDMLPTVMKLVESPNADLQQAGIRCLGMIGASEAIPKLVDMLEAGGDVTKAAQAALGNLSRKEVTAALLEALQTRPTVRGPAVDVLIDLKCYDAIDPLVEIASKPDPDTYAVALHGLRGIADPDKTDIPRLVKLLLRTEAGKHRDEVEKTILLVCDKLPTGADRSELVLASLAQVDQAEKPKYLPVLGRLGGTKALAMIEADLKNENAEIREAAVRALCNWPNADVAEQLLKLATDSDKPGPSADGPACVHSRCISKE